MKLGANMLVRTSEPLRPLISRLNLSPGAKLGPRLALLCAMSLLGAMSHTAKGEPSSPAPTSPPITAPAAMPATATNASTAPQPVKLLLDGTEYANKPAQLATAKGTAFKRAVVNGYWMTKSVQNNAKT